MESFKRNVINNNIVGIINGNSTSGVGFLDIYDLPRRRIMFLLTSTSTLTAILMKH